MINLSKNQIRRLSHKEKTIYILLQKSEYPDVIASVDELLKNGNVQNARLLILIKAAAMSEIGYKIESARLLESLAPWDYLCEDHLSIIQALIDIYSSMSFSSLVMKYTDFISKESKQAIVDFSDVKTIEHLVIDGTETNQMIMYLISCNMNLEAGLLTACAKKSGIILNEEIRYYISLKENLQNVIDFFEKSEYDCRICVQEENVPLEELYKIICKTLGHKIDIVRSIDNLFQFNDRATICLCPVKDLDTIFSSHEYSCKAEIYYSDKESYIHNSMSCFLFGNYFELMEIKYGYKCNFIDYSMSDYLFSVVIPVRNDGFYLKFAIESCLRQEYEGEYEILISDNSSLNNTKVKECVMEFNDPRIRYIRTPRELPLSKSFEFAFLSARGKYIVSIGSDDALLLNCLQILDKSIRDNPNVDIFNWKVCSYLWGDEQYQNNTVDFYYKEDAQSTIINSREEFVKLKSGRLSYMNTPALYLRTCFSKRLIQRYLEVTGKFEDGISQDLFTAPMSLVLSDNFLRLSMPLTIAGSSYHSAGLASRKLLMSVENYFSIMALNQKSLCVDNYRYGSFSKLSIIADCCGIEIAELREILRSELWIHEIENPSRLIFNRLSTMYSHIPSKVVDRKYIIEQLTFCEVYLTDEDRIMLNKKKKYLFFTSKMRAWIKKNKLVCYFLQVLRNIMKGRQNIDGKHTVLRIKSPNDILVACKAVDSYFFGKVS